MLPACPTTLPISSILIAKLIEEHRGIPVHLGSPVVNGGRMLIRRSTPALMLLTFAIRFAHNPRLPLSRG